ncbi:MAG: hypothetical protein OXH15_06705 [Gammaproteobacteria bacterium]|nr:hypothetical protein [Gammaproteobacteria bacterium]
MSAQGDPAQVSAQTVTLDANGEPPWRTAGTPILNALLDHVPSATDRRPWQAGHVLHIQALGGLVSKERRRYTILGHGEYYNQIGGCRTLAADSQTLETTADLTTSVGEGDAAPDVDAPWGRDSLTVDGDAEITVGGRMVMLSGFATRNWNGGVMRLASMEGVICGGAFLRLIASPSVTLSGMMTGDVYGGCARVAAVRCYLAVLHYRAAAAAAWANGVYVRNATFVIEPLIGTPSAGTPPSRMAAKLARMGQVLSAARMVCPPLDIFVGVATFVPMGLYGLYGLIAGIVKRPNPIPPAGPPRTRVQNVGVNLQSCTSMLVM